MKFAKKKREHMSSAHYPCDKEMKGQLHRQNTQIRTEITLRANFTLMVQITSQRLAPPELVLNRLSQES